MEAGDEIGINHPEPEFHDVTVDKLEFQHAIDTLRWISLGKAMDKYLAIRTVRCPWGCGTYLHQTNMLPFEDFLLAQSNYPFRSASKCKQATRNWTDSCRPDFQKSKVLLEENEDFICRPLIIVNEDGVFILACENHSTKTTLRYLHIPENPTGSLYTSASNQYAPV
jgi:hypothetical protein